ncbi:agmatinase [Clostridia bacterium]|nr:agmatinase [Clostridia bacterium]
MSKFIACDSNYGDSSVVLFGAPFDGTSSYRPGSRFASQDMRGDSFAIETFSPYQQKDLADSNVYDAGDLEFPFGNTERVLDIIEDFTRNILADGKVPVMIGGEHLVTLGAVRAVYAKYPGLSIVHFDAHADMRDTYLSEKLSHATVMRRCADLLGRERIFQFGIRSGEREEFAYSKANHFIITHTFNNIEKTAAALASASIPVYLTIDLDVLDPAELPGTGTPEAGGVSFIELLAATLEVIATSNVVAIDINELSPRLDTSGRSTSLANKFLRETLISITLKEQQ